MADNAPQFIDYSGSQQNGEHTHGDHSLDLWEPMIIPRAQVESEIDRLASIPTPNNGVRRSRMVHPRSVDERPIAGHQALMSALMSCCRESVQRPCVKILAS